MSHEDQGRVMGNRELKNKPLVEAIFEMRWELQSRPGGMAVDPHYRLLLGRLYDRLNKDYPSHEELDAAGFPDEMVGYVVQHRFRAAENGWPLVQLGPGVFTVNETDKYSWGDFSPRVRGAVGAFLEAYPQPDQLRFKKLTLRNVDAVDFDYTSEDVLQFLRDKLKVGIDMPPNLFEKAEVTRLPDQVVLQQDYRSAKPAGTIRLRIATGERRDRKAIIWETMLQSADGDVPPIPDGFQRWLNESHEVVNDWFFKMIDGELRTRFS